MPITVSHAKSDTIADYTGTITEFNSTGGTATVAATNVIWSTSVLNINTVARIWSTWDGWSVKPVSMSQIQDCGRSLSRPTRLPSSTHGSSRGLSKKTARTLSPTTSWLMSWAKFGLMKTVI